MESFIWILAGALILISVWLAQTVGQWWLLLAILVADIWLYRALRAFVRCRSF
jgi:hypothetical protein